MGESVFFPIFLAGTIHFFILTFSGETHPPPTHPHTMPPSAGLGAMDAATGLLLDDDFMMHEL